MGGVQISASHNPAQYNGLKLFNGEGRVIPASGRRKVLARYRSGEMAWTTVEGVGRLQPLARKRRRPSATDTGPVDAERDSATCRFRVLLDANHGAGSILGRRLLIGSAAKSRCWAERPMGNFEHPPEPTAENLAGVCDR